MRINIISLKYPALDFLKGLNTKRKTVVNMSFAEFHFVFKKITWCNIIWLIFCMCSTYQHEIFRLTVALRKFGWMKFRCGIIKAQFLNRNLLRDIECFLQLFKLLVILPEGIVPIQGAFPESSDRILTNICASLVDFSK